MTNSTDEHRALDYVLGWTSGPARWWLSRQLPGNPHRLARVEQWQAMLQPLHGVAEPVAPPPEIWNDILGKLDEEKKAPGSRGLFGLAASGLAIAGLAAFLLWRPVMPLYVAELRSAAGPAVSIAIDRAGTLMVSSGSLPVVAADKSLELWMIPAGGAPQPLGVITGSQSKLPVSLLDGLDGPVTLAVSIEPLGGSPSGLPTGPVVISGALKPA